MAASRQATQLESDASRTLDAAEIPAAGERLSLEEMSRIMDVAASLRKERALVDEQLNIGQIKAKLRERLLEAAKISGDPVTAEEVDAAVRQYYEQLHEFREPSASLATFAAHLWVSRGVVLAMVAAAVAAFATVWGLLATGVLPGKVRNERIAAAAAAQFESQLDQAERTAASIRQLSNDASVDRDVKALVSSARAAANRKDPGSVAEALGKLDLLRQELELDYTLAIASRPGEQSGLDRYFGDEKGTRVSGLYVFVEARDGRGNAVQVPIENRESGRIDFVSRWAEQVPPVVFDRLKADKEADGVLDERTFGVKRRGERTLEVTLPGVDGKPLARRGQLTSW